MFFKTWNIMLTIINDFVFKNMFICVWINDRNILCRNKQSVVCPTESTERRGTEAEKKRQTA